MSMIKLFDLMSDNCKNCYKCIRYCPVKAIRFQSGKAEIDMDKCIACGQCFVVCPKHARNADNDYADVYGRLKSGARIAALIDSSYLAMYDEPEKFVAGLKKLGFDSVQEIAAATARITDGIYGGAQESEIYDNSKLSFGMSVCVQILSRACEISDPGRFAGDRPGKAHKKQRQRRLYGVYRAVPEQTV